MGAPALRFFSMQFSDGALNAELARSGGGKIERVNLQQSGRSIEEPEAGVIVAKKCKNGELSQLTEDEINGKIRDLFG